jgi:S-adenosylmethionine synthetase
VACETLVTTGLAVVAGEVTTNAIVNVPDIVREAVKKAGYVLATTTKSGVTLSAQDPLQLERIRVSNTTGVRGLAAALS